MSDLSVLTEQQINLAMVCSEYLTHLSHEYETLENFKPDDVIVIFKIIHPSISLINYIKRMIRYLKLVDDDLFYAIGLIEHFICLCKKRKTYILIPETVFELLATAVLITMKFNSDYFFSNAYYAKVFGVSKIILARCEINFLVYLQFSLTIPIEIFVQYKEYIYEYVLSTLEHEEKLKIENP
jgi:hypothetical protein